MQRKFHGFTYISIALTTLPSTLTDSYFPALRTCEFSYPTTFQFLSLWDSSDTTSDIPYVDPGPGNGHSLHRSWLDLARMSLRALTRTS